MHNIVKVEVASVGKLPHIASMIYNQPLLITEEKLFEILEAIGSRINIVNEWVGTRTDLSSAAYNDFVGDTSIAIIPIEGTLTHRPMSGVSSMSGLMSYQEIKAKFDTALNDPQVATILLNINSNGGQVNGCFDLVDHIYNSRGQKPIIAISNESAYSAAYAIGSAADKLYVTRTAGVGSIGVIALHADISKKLENEGIKYTAIKAGKRKDDLSPYKPLTDKAKSTIQEHVDDIYHLFVNTIARNRNLESEKIYSTEAQTYNGQKAVEIGLADKVTTYDSIINTYGGNNNMDLQAELDKVKAELIKLQTQHDMLEADLKETEASLPNMIKEAEKIGHETELSRIMIILEKCSVANKLDLAIDLIKNDNTPEQAAALIMQSKALESEREQISSAPGNDSGSINNNVLLKNAQNRADAYTSR